MVTGITARERTGPRCSSPMAPASEPPAAAANAPARSAAAPIDDAEDRRIRVRAGTISLVASILILAAKFGAYWLTKSQAVFSDAMESIVNVAAASAALFAISFSARPADEDHPYGHGKIEFVTAGFEGGLIAFAGLTILYEAIHALLAPPTALPRLETGLAIVAAAAVANLLLGVFLLRTGRRCGSPALQADGHHVISDFWTSAGAIGGLALVWITGILWIDAVTAIVFALLLFWTGGKLLRQAARGLLDEANPEVIGEVAAALEAARAPGIIEVHDLRAIHVGDRHHVDLHMVVPEFWTVDRAHAEMDAYEGRVRLEHAARIELQFHVDPCEQAYCERCDLADCAVRRAAFAARRTIDAASVVRGPEPPRRGAVHG